MNRVLQPRPLFVLGLNVWMGTAAGADELVEVPYREFRPGPMRTPFFFRRVKISLAILALELGVPNLCIDNICDSLVPRAYEVRKLIWTLYLNEERIWKTK